MDLCCTFSFQEIIACVIIPRFDLKVIFEWEILPEGKNNPNQKVLKVTARQWRRRSRAQFQRAA